MLVSDYPRPGERPRRCSVDAAYFDKLTPQNAYWLGFLLADGCVAFRRRNGVVCQHVLTASSKDREHVKKLQDAMQSTYALSGPHLGVWQLIVPNYDLCLSLERWGIVPQKSLTASPPKLPKALERHWARGVIDGDGSFNAYYRPPRAKKFNGKGRPSTGGRHVLMLTVAGSHAVTSWFRNKFGGSLRPVANIWVWSINDSRASAVIRWCYEDAEPSCRLDRKYARAAALRIVKED